MLWKELSMVIAIIIAIAYPVVPTNHGGGAEEMEYVDCGLSRELWDHYVYKYEYPEILQRVMQKIQESCSRVLEKGVEYYQVEYCFRRNLFINELPNNTFTHALLNEFFENGCQNWRAIKACLKPYGVILNKCWSVGDKVNGAMDSMNNFFCDSDNKGKRLARLFALADSEICVDSYTDDVFLCIKNYSVSTEIEFTLIPSHKDFCRTLNIGQVCAPQRSTSGCDKSVLGNLVTYSLRVLSNAMECSPIPGSYGFVWSVSGVEHTLTPRFLLLPGILVPEVFKLLEYSKPGFVSCVDGPLA